MQVNDVVPFPNPYMFSGGDLKMSFDVTQPADNIAITIYTVAFRKVIEAQAAGPYFRGSTAVFHARLFGGLSGGVYYTVLTAKNGNEQAVSKPVVMVILR
jgi:hypothetical protein